MIALPSTSMRSATSKKLGCPRPIFAVKNPKAALAYDRELPE
jgi:hypothetical protein